MMKKSDNAMKTIGEVAKLLDLPTHVLRFWESKFPQIEPLKRAGGRRYYRPEDIRNLKRIQELLYEKGYTIKGAVAKLSKRQKKKPTPANENYVMSQQQVQAVSHSDKLKVIKADLQKLKALTDA